MINQNRLKELLYYNPESGVFTWIESCHGGRVKGVTAGSLNHDGYIRICIDGKRYSAHRLAWLYIFGNFPEKFIDHKNRIKNDNRIDNLRSATKEQNQQNTGISRRNTSGIKGVSYHNKSRKWRVSISKNGVRNSLGSFSSFEDAANAYKNASFLMHGEFSCPK